MKTLPTLNAFETIDNVPGASRTRIRLRVHNAVRNDNQETHTANTGVHPIDESPAQYRIPTETTTSCVLTFLLGA